VLYRHCFAIEYAIRKVRENQVGLKFNGTRQLLAYADDIGHNIVPIKKNIEAFCIASKEGGLEVGAEKSICCCLVTIMQANQLRNKKAGRTFKLLLGLFL
jgi:hypothetical protein